ncbi:MAG: ABC transporter substrate-binding protein [Pseudomonadota bacterium]
MRFAGLCLAALLALTAAAPFDSAKAADEVVIKTAILTVKYRKERPISRLDLPPRDLGVAGARQALEDNNSTGRFLGQVYEMAEASAKPDKAAAKLDELIADGATFIAINANADDLLALADHVEGQDVLLVNVAATDNRLRNDDCRINVVHAAPSRAQITDGLAQYMVWKKWREWFLIHGSNPEDLLKAESYRRSAKKFGLKITEERVFEDTGGARRSDSGHVLVQKQIPVFTNRADDHDVVVAADEAGVFGVYLPYRLNDPRPVVGDAGLIASMWHPGHESWGATQLQRRFERKQKRQMRDVDYNAWIGLRTIGEAVTRAETKDFAGVKSYLLSQDLEIAGFKGIPLNYRPWNNQLRHGVILGDGKLVVTVSPQDEFLHQHTRLDTLGFDEPESSCSFN